MVLTVVGSSIPDFFREFINQGIKATDVPVLGLDVVEADLEGPRHQAARRPPELLGLPAGGEGRRRTTKFLKQWAGYVKAKNGALPRRRGDRPDGLGL